MDNDPNQAVKVEIATDNKSASLLFVGDQSRDGLSLSTCKAILRAHGLRPTPEDFKRLDAVFENLPPEGEDTRVVVCKAKLPVDGKDGWVEWHVQSSASDAAAKAKAEADEAESDTGNGSVMPSHYDRSEYVMVETNQLLATIHPPVMGHDGLDVKGNAIAAKQGRDVELVLDESVRKTGGQLFAMEDGVLTRKSRVVRISKMLTVGGQVDFHSGNIDFDGDLLVNKGVSDCFEVNATGSVEIRGLVEAANIQAGEDLLLMGGMAGRDRGNIQVGGNVTAKHLNRVVGKVGGNLWVQKEIVGCQLHVRGGVQAKTASLIDGQLSVSGDVQLGRLGSESLQPTLLMAGHAPVLQERLQQAQLMLAHLQEHDGKLEAELEQIKSFQGKIPQQLKERMTELSFERRQVGKMVTKAQDVLDRLMAKAKSVQSSEIWVHDHIHAEARIQIAGNVYKFNEAIRGPICIRMDARGAAHYQRGNEEPRPLARVTTVSSAPSGGGVQAQAA